MTGDVTGDQPGAASVYPWTLTANGGRPHRARAWGLHLPWVDVSPSSLIPLQVNESEGTIRLGGEA